MPLKTESRAGQELRTFGSALRTSGQELLKAGHKQRMFERRLLEFELNVHQGANSKKVRPLFKVIRDRVAFGTRRKGIKAGAVVVAFGTMTTTSAAGSTNILTPDEDRGKSDEKERGPQRNVIGTPENISLPFEPPLETLITIKQVVLSLEPPAARTPAGKQNLNEMHAQLALNHADPRCPVRTCPVEAPPCAPDPDCAKEYEESDAGPFRTFADLGMRFHVHIVSQAFLIVPIVFI